MNHRQFVCSCAEVHGEGVPFNGLVVGVHAAFARHHRPPAGQALFQDPKEWQGLPPGRLGCGSRAPPRRLPHSLETSVHRERAQLEVVDRDMPVPHRRRGTTLAKSSTLVCIDNVWFLIILRTPLQPLTITIFSGWVEQAEAVAGAEWICRRRSSARSSFS